VDTPSFLRELADLAKRIQDAWIVLGDFNLLRHESEKKITAGLTTDLPPFSMKPSLL
jgi:hypothetical protein